MFRHRPEAAAATQTLPEAASGTCYVARQSHLVFGHDRRDPVEWRPVVSLARREDRIVVLPATTQSRPDFFHLAPGQCFLKQQPKQPERDSYLCPRYESLPQHALREIGVLPHPVRMHIAQWLNATMAGER